MYQVQERLSGSELSRRARLLGFRPDDAAELEQVATAVLCDHRQLGRIAELAERVRGGIGVLDLSGVDPWAGVRSDPAGVLEVLALLASADEVVAYQQARGVEPAQAWHSLSDLGQQVWVHRLTYGRFGMHTQGWLRIAWAGGFAWLGRLQFNLQWLTDRWVLSCHIPRTGPLKPDLVDDSFRLATAFFAEHFADFPTTEFWCSSWLLDPELAAALPGSNIAAFQHRWRLVGEPAPGDADALFFTFARRGEVDLAALPRRTSLQRVIIERLSAGRHWGTWQGLLRQADGGSAR